MSKYKVIGIWTATKVIGIFEAKSSAEAKSMAEEDTNNYVSLCHQCSSEIELSDNTSDQFIVHRD